MKQEKIIAGADILATQMNHWTLFSIAVTTAVLFGKKEPPLALWAACALLPAFFFFIRRYTNRFPLMAGSHLLCLLLLFAAPVPDLAVKIPLCLYGAGLAIYSFSLRIRTEERLDNAISPPVAIGTAALSLFLLHYEKYTEADFYFAGVVIFYFICYYIRCYLNSYLYFLTVNAGSTGYIPRREIFLSGIRLSTAFTLFGMAAVLLISDWNWPARLYGALKQGFLWLREHGFFAFIASLFRRETEQPPEQMTAIPSASPAGMVMEFGEPGLFWKILEKVIGILIPVLLLLLFGLFLLRFIKMIYERFRENRLFAPASATDSGRDIHERYEVKKEKKNQKRFLAFLNPTERIRRIYRQRIWARRESLMHNEASRPLGAYTARECGRLLAEEPLSRIYEKARYSGEECTREDLKKI
ncbi:MAG: hypothetical protein NC392_05855 [Roseburia sp.]|nr:hypothetical protein [Roseburia sp.]MCM1201624.1 hypothetical protein [Bacteroides fragilis]